VMAKYPLRFGRNGTARGGAASRRVRRYPPRRARFAEKPRRGDRGAEERLRRSIHTLAHIPVVRHVAANLHPLGRTLPNNTGTNLEQAAARASSSTGAGVDSGPCERRRSSSPPGHEGSWPPPEVSRFDEDPLVIGVGAPRAALLPWRRFSAPSRRVFQLRWP
jgi:hypothetical protein